MNLTIGMELLIAFLVSIAAETRSYVPKTSTPDFDDYIDHLYREYGALGFTSRLALLALAETLFVVQMLNQ
ncbi:MAG: hypothetical protein ACR2PS_07965 [Pseudomonadales bacterium]